MKIPKKATLRKYGLSVEDYTLLFHKQNGLCPICENPLYKRTNIDHYHVRNWKKLSMTERKKYVRGILCWWCNKTYLGRSITVKRAENVVKYLKSFEKRNHEIS